MTGYKILVWLFIICLMAENGSQGRKIRELQADVESLQQDVCEAFDALNNIQNSATNIVVFPGTYESD